MHYHGMAGWPTPPLEDVFADRLVVAAVMPLFATDIAENCNQKWVFAVENTLKPVLL